MVWRSAALPVVGERVEVRLDEEGVYLFDGASGTNLPLP